MARSREEILSYQRGYYAGSTGRWPERRPPLGPGECARALTAAAALRDALDGWLARFGEDDPITQHLGPLIDAFDAAAADLSLDLLERWAEKVLDAGTPASSTRATEGRDQTGEIPDCPS